MANDEHVALLKQGVAAWHKWRDESPDIRPDLIGAHLIGADLRGADLRGADLSEANLHRAILHRASFVDANLFVADLSEANLTEAILSGANLSGADLSQACLYRAALLDASLSRAKLWRANLRGANLLDANLNRAILSEANLLDANLNRAILSEANLSGANLREADLSGANLREADLSGANLSGADLIGADVIMANLTMAKLTMAKLSGANFTRANLTRADLSGAYLTESNLLLANLSGATLREVGLQLAMLVHADLTDADLTGCRIHGASAWGLKLERTKQQNLIITHEDEPAITVDNIEVAQFIYLLLHNQKIRDVIDTITSKAVLILGRFTAERKAVLDALREELRKRDYLPILFDFDKPANRDITETISLLARMARFVVADITDARAIPQELNVIVPDLPSVAVQPLLLKGSSEYGMFEHYQRYPWVLPLYEYETRDQLIAALNEQVIEPAERKALELRSGARPIPTLEWKPKDKPSRI
jgi:uncharacterized protein YjbI with pentapeptide repeats